MLSRQILGVHERIVLLAFFVLSLPLGTLTRSVPRPASALARVGALTPAQGRALPTGLGAALRGALGSRAAGRQDTPAHATVPSQQAELTARDGASGDWFGYAVALSGNTALIGASHKSNPAAAYVFVRNGATWIQQTELTSGDITGAAYFGSSVALNGNTALVGAVGENGTGAVYVFVRSGTIWTQQAELAPSDGTSGDQFGYSAALSGNTALIGSNDKNGEAGAAYVFVRNSRTWTQQAELTANDGVSGDQFGWSVALSGNTALVGAPRRNNRAGSVYIFLRNGTIWTQQTDLIAGDTVSGDWFGSSVALSGNIALIGAQDKNNQFGAAYLLMRNGARWSQQAELFDLCPCGPGDQFGWSVALSGSAALVGALNKNQFAGAAYLFVGRGASWIQRAALTASDGAPGDLFGASVALSENSALVGANDKNNSAGAAYLFAGSGTISSRRPTSAVPTKVIVFHPMGIRGRFVTGTCVGSAVAPRPGAWRCFVRGGPGISDVQGNILEPCFSASPQPTDVICNASPLGDTRGIELKLERPPTNPNTRWGPPVAWLVRLADKTTCEFVEGAPLSVTISGRLTFIHDSCGPWISNRSWHILDAYQTGRVWTARKVLVEYKPGIGAIVLKSFPIAITTAWL